MLKKKISSFSFFLLLLFQVVLISNCVISTTNLEEDEDVLLKVGRLVKKKQRESIAQTDYGQISAVEINDGINGPYQLQFFTLEPNSLFLPVLLHADMVFYVQTGSGSLSWVEEEEEDRNQIDVKRGDIYRIKTGSVFFIKSNLESQREKLRISAIFTNPTNIQYSSHNPYSEPYSTVSNLITGFDRKVLQAAFQVSEEVIDNLMRTSKSPPIVHAPSTNKTNRSGWTIQMLEALTGYEFENKKKKTMTYNILEKKPDFENCNGWSKTVNRKDLKALKGSDIGVFMVNLTQGSMMGPHWNPRASEIALVLHGQGMVRVVCSSMGSVQECKNMRFRVKEGDVFVVPRFHPMAQMAYNNDSFVFMGFSTMARNNYPQFLIGKSSVLQTLDRDVLAMSFNVPNGTIDQLLSSQTDSIILGCVSCAEEEEMRMEEEIEKERQEEEDRTRQATRKEEEAARKQEEEYRRRQEEEAARKEKEDRKRQKAEEDRRQHEAQKKEEEEEEKRAKEEQQREEAEREEEEAKRQEEEREKRQREKEEREWQEEGSPEGSEGWEEGGGAPGWEEGGGRPRKIFKF